LPPYSSAPASIVSAADSQLICRLLRDEASKHASTRTRQGIGWFVVLLSFSVAGHSIARLRGWDMSLSDNLLVWVAGASFAALFVLWRWRRRQAARSVDAAA